MIPRNDADSWERRPSREINVDLSGRRLQSRRQGQLSGKIIRHSCPDNPGFIRADLQLDEKMQDQEREQLELQIGKLRAENEILAERADDLQLLGAISAKLAQETSAQGIISTVVESAGSLKGLAYCAFLFIDGASGTVLADCGPNPGISLSSQSFPLDPNIPRELAHGSLFYSCDQMDALGLAVHEVARVPRDARCCLVPVIYRWNVNALLCVHPSADETYREKIRPLLHRICELVQSRLDALPLLAELAELNKMLESKVRERTSEMERSNALLKASEESLRASEERYRMLAEAAQDSIFIIDRAGCIQYINRFGAALLRSTPEEIVGKDIEYIFPMDARARWMRDIETVARIGSPLLLQDRVPYAGREVLLDTALVPLRDNDDRITSVLGVARDITWRRNIEESKTKLESQLYQSQKMEAVGRLAGGVAHDFNNLLTAVLGYSDFALTRLLPQDPLHKEILEIREAAEHATALTRQLLAFSRKQILQPKVIDLAEVVLDVQKMLERLLGEDIILDVRCQPGEGTVKADPGQIQQVVLNLAVNARDAMPDGGTLTIATQRAELGNEFVSADLPPHSGGSIMLTVSDTGCGMDPETQAHLFEPFFTTKGPGKGTGLGLATVHGIISQSGGHIAVQSEPEVGTVFKIYLPEHQDQDDSAEAEAAERQASLGTETVLLVEDSIQVRTLIRHILKTRGYRVMEATDAPAAIELSGREQGMIHLLLTDVVMPGMSGRALAEQLKLSRPEMKVLYMSGYTDDQVMMHGVLDSPYAFIYKPFRSEDLALKVRNVIETQ